jgi:predicted alpha-1,2-mannosidase
MGLCIFHFFLLFLKVQTLSAANKNSIDNLYSQYVDTFIGSGGSGFGSGGDNPGAQVPFCAIRIGPDTTSKIFNKDFVIPFDHYSGYNYEDQYMRAFSHTRLVGAGVGDFGNFGLMPLSLDKTKTSDKELTKILTTVNGHTFKFNHANESSKPGYYSVLLLNDNSEVNALNEGIYVELLATSTHTGMHQYTYINDGASNGGKQHGFLLDVCHAAMKDDSSKYCKNATIQLEVISKSNNKNNSNFNVQNNGTSNTSTMLRIKSTIKMAGSLTERSTIGGVYVYFVADIPMMSYQIWKDKTLLSQSNVAVNQPISTSSGSLGIYLYSSPLSLKENVVQTLQFNVAISFISVDQAIQNMLHLNPFSKSNKPFSKTTKMTFNEKRLYILNLWEKKLSIVRIHDDEISSPATPKKKESDGNSNDTSLTNKKKFYTALYHSYCVPTTFSEYGGYYLGMDNKIHQLNEVASDVRKHAYSDMSLWDVHRTQFPWLSLSMPDVYEDVIGSLQEMARVGGDIPRWPLANVYTGCMIGSHGMVSIAESILKNQTRCLNKTYIYEKMKLAATSENVKHGGRIDVANYTKYNFVPNEDERLAASLTLAYAFDDHAIATVAKSLGLMDEYSIFHNRSKIAYEVLWSDTAKLLCPRSINGTLHCPSKAEAITPYPFEKQYTESDGL